MRISDWSSDVCSSDLRPIVGGGFRVSYNDAIYLKYVPDARTGRGRNYHSVYFEILGELGYVGLAIYLALLFAVWRMGSRTITLTAQRPDLHWAGDLARMSRSEERRVGKECVSACRSRWLPYN